jgi:hypothetical protein
MEQQMNKKGFLGKMILFVLAAIGVYILLKFFKII